MPLIDNSPALLQQSNVWFANQYIDAGSGATKRALTIRNGGKVPLDIKSTNNDLYIFGDGTSGSRIHIGNSGAISMRISVENSAQGVSIGGSTATPSINGYLNALAYQVNGTLLCSGIYESAEQTITSGSTTTLAHGLGAVPKEAHISLVCKTAELGYAVGDEVLVSLVHDASGAANSGLSLCANTSNIYVTVGSTVPGLKLMDRTTGTPAAITAANWRFKVRAKKAS